MRRIFSTTWNARPELQDLATHSFDRHAPNAHPSHTAYARLAASNGTYHHRRGLMLDWLDIDFSSLKSLTFFDLTVGIDPLDEYKFYGSKDIFGEGKGAGGYWEVALTNEIRISIGLLQGRISLVFDNYAAIGMELLGDKKPMFALTLDFKAALQYTVNTLQQWASAKFGEFGGAEPGAGGKSSMAKSAMTKLLGGASAGLDMLNVQLVTAVTGGFDKPTSKALENAMIEFAGAPGMEPNEPNPIATRSRRTQEEADSIAPGHRRRLNLADSSSKTSFCEFVVNVEHLRQLTPNVTVMNGLLKSTREVFTEYMELLKALAALTEESGQMCAILLPLKGNETVNLGVDSTKGLTGLKITFGTYASHMERFALESLLFNSRPSVDDAIVLATDTSMTILCKIVNNCNDLLTWADTEGGRERLASGIPPVIESSVVQQSDFILAQLDSMNQAQNTPVARQALAHFQALAAGAPGQIFSALSLMTAIVGADASFDLDSNPVGIEWVQQALAAWRDDKPAIVRDVLELASRRGSYHAWAAKDELAAGRQHKALQLIASAVNDDTPRGRVVAAALEAAASGEADAFADEALAPAESVLAPLSSVFARLTEFRTEVQAVPVRLQELRGMGALLSRAVESMGLLGARLENEHESWLPKADTTSSSLELPHLLGVCDSVRDALAQTGLVAYDGKHVRLQRAIQNRRWKVAAELISYTSWCTIQRTPCIQVRAIVVAGCGGIPLPWEPSHTPLLSSLTFTASNARYDHLDVRNGTVVLTKLPSIVVVDRSGRGSLTWAQLDLVMDLEVTMAGRALCGVNGSPPVPVILRASQPSVTLRMFTTPQWYKKGFSKESATITAAAVQLNSEGRCDPRCRLLSLSHLARTPSPHSPALLTRDLTAPTAG